MDSPFIGYENATLTFGQLTTETTTDDFGNSMPLFVPLPIVSMLRLVTNPAIDRLLQAQQQIEADGLALEGYCVDPMVLPMEVMEQTEANTTFNNVPGKFVLTLINPPYGRYGIGALIEAEAGTKIAGWFVPNREVMGEPIDGGQLPSQGSMKIPFSFGDATPKTIYTIKAGKTVFTVQIVIQIPFNGAGAALSLGDAEDSDRLVRTEQVDPTFVAEYETNPAYTYDTATPIALTIVPGEGCTQGSGYVLLEV
ncbi:hypothetical protein IFO70_10420 [Phormidium tenue FACHB-886]|nr:hypothetical protein [Phormidium tenue FACHB-886]